MTTSFELGMTARALVAAVTSAAVLVLGGGTAFEPAPPAEQMYGEVYPYDGKWTFVRVWTTSYYGGFDRRGGWSHDYPASDINMSTILREMTHVDAPVHPMGGNVLRLDDPRLMQYPFAYVSEPGDWRVTEAEAGALREYLLKGGFVVFDDFFAEEMGNLHRQMSLVLPELHYIRLDGTEEIWDSFFRLDAPAIYLEGPRKYGTPQFWGLFTDNDKSKRMLSIANAQADIGDLWEWAAEGYYPLDPTNDAFRLGVNYIVYALTH
jgi:hypothetical protein